MKNEDKKELDAIFEFCREADKEKFIGRQTYLTDGKRKENDAEHAWHASLMALLLSGYANEKIDVLKTISMLLIHDIVEIDAGDTYAYDEEMVKTQSQREEAAAKRIFGILPENTGKQLLELWHEFEKGESPEASFARVMDNLQPMMLNAATDGKAWAEHEVHINSILKRNEITPKGSEKLWEYGYESFVKPNLEKGRIKE
jgi:putative hydrolase of HD superfamily